MRRIKYIEKPFAGTSAFFYAVILHNKRNGKKNSKLKQIVIPNAVCRAENYIQSDYNSGRYTEIFYFSIYTILKTSENYYPYYRYTTPVAHLRNKSKNKNHNVSCGHAISGIVSYY